MANISYKIEAKLIWGDGSNSGIDYDLYGYRFEFGDPGNTYPLVYWRNQGDGAGLTLNGDAYPNCETVGGITPPEIITGEYNVPCDDLNKFFFYWNHYASCEPEGGITEFPLTTVTITNTGNETIYVDGSLDGLVGFPIAPGEQRLWTSDSIVYIEKEG